MSLPAQNARPLPVSTATRRSRRLFTVATYPASVSVISGVTALSFAARLRVMTATWPSMSRRTSPGPAVPWLMSPWSSWSSSGFAQGVAAGALDDLAHRGLGLAVMPALDGGRNTLVARQCLAVMPDRVGVQRPDGAQGNADDVVDIEQQVIVGGDEYGPVKGQVGLDERGRLVDGRGQAGQGAGRSEEGWVGKEGR